MKIDQLTIDLVRKFIRKLSESTPRHIADTLITPLTSAEVQDLFTEIRWNFGLVPLRLVLMRHDEFMKKIGMATVAAVGGGEVSINLDYLDALRRKRGEGAALLALIAALVHENGHPYIPYRAPGTFRNKLDDVKRVGKALGDKKAIAINILLNIVYDAIIDVFSFDRTLYDPREILNCFEAVHEEEEDARRKVMSKVVAKMSKSMPGLSVEIPEAQERGYISQFLISFRQVMMGIDFGICEIEKPVLNVAIKTVKLIRDTEGETAKIEACILTLAKWITELSTSEPDQDDDDGEGDGDGAGGEGEGDGDGDGDDDGDDDGEPQEGKGKPGKPGKGKPKKGKSGNLTEDELKKLAKALEEAMEELGMNSESATAEDLDENPLEKKLEEVNIGNTADRDAAAKLLGLNEDDAAFHFLWTIAAQKVKLQPPLGALGEGTVFAAANVPWQLGMPFKDLDIRSTIESGGRFLPGVTTVQPHYVPGPGVPQEGTSPRIMGSFDLSGSMLQPSPVRAVHRNADTVLITCFAIIHDAKRRKVPVAMNLFGDRNYYVDWSNNYEKVARDLFDHVNTPGWGNSCTGLEKCQPKLKTGDLLIYATDFYLCGYEERGAAALQGILNDGVNITFIAMFNHCGHQAGIPFVECKTLDDLEGVALKSISVKK